MNSFIKVEQMVNKILPEVIELRHSIHQNPELACEEYDTAKLIREKLAATSLRILPPFLDTDVVAFLDGKSSGKNVTLRADMDALPLVEQTEVSYKSRKEGLMHACGHDGNTAMLYGAALILDALKNEFSGSVRFVFQPGEEIVGAARHLIAAGALKDPVPDMSFALHVKNNAPENTVLSRPGLAMAAAEFFKILVKGKGGHGAIAHLTVDPICIGAQIINSLQTIVSRRVASGEAVVISVCKFISGFNGNVIPDTAELEGTVRYLNSEIGKDIPKIIEDIVRGICESAGALYELEYNKTYIPLVNDLGAVDIGRKVVAMMPGVEWKDTENVSMGGEDFAYFLQKSPGAMFELGQGENHPSIHNPCFDFNDDTLKTGIMLLVLAALEALIEKQNRPIPKTNMLN